MAIISTKNLGIWLQKADAVPVDLAAGDVQGITAADPPVVTLAAAAPAGVADGDVIILDHTGVAELDGRMLTLTNMGGGGGDDFELEGIDLTGATIGTPGNITATIYPASAFVRICASDFQIAASSVSEIDASTYCEDISIPGRVTPGSITITGNVEKGDDGFDALELANLDGQPRLIKIVPQGDNGSFVGEIIVSGLSYSFALGDRITYTFTGNQAKAISYVR